MQRTIQARTPLDIRLAKSTLARRKAEETTVTQRLTLQLMQMMFALIRSLFANKAALAMENLALRQQLAIYKRKRPRPRLTDLDRAFWTVLKDQFAAWADALIIVKPDTVMRWQKRRFRDFWRRKSKPGRPRIDRQHIAFIKRISGDHPEYGEDRIALELEIKFGIKHSPATVRKYMVKPARPRRDSMTWRTFLKNQADAIWTCDFCVQYTVRFTALYIFVIMELGSRKVVHFNVTEHPTLAWVKQQIRDATFEDQPKFLLHDNDGIFGQLGKPATAEVNGKKVSCRSSLDLWLAETMGIRGIPTPYHAPNANARVERLVGTLRRELLDRILVWNEGQLRGAMAEYVGWYNAGRVHQGIHGIPDPDPELAAPKPANGKLVARPVLNGLHHDYRVAA
jgi:putative transposase